MFVVCWLLGNWREEICDSALLWRCFFVTHLFLSHLQAFFFGRCCQLCIEDSRINMRAVVLLSNMNER